MSKKLFIIIGIVLAIILIILVGYYFTTKPGVNTDTNTSVFKNFFPFGGNDTNTSTTTETGVTLPEKNTQQQNFVQKLRKIWSDPVAGAGIVDTKQGSVVRHIEKSTGHIYETELFSPVQNRISNTTIPLVYDAVWGNTNNSLIARYLRDDDQTIDTYTLTLNQKGVASTTLPKDATSTADNLISGVQLPAHITDYSVFDTNVFYLIQGSSGTSGIVSNFSGTKKKQVWSSPLTELLSQFVNTNTVALTTKPYPNVSGYLYFINTTNGTSKKIIGDISGLSTLVSPDATKVLFSSQTDSLTMSVYSISGKSSTQITPATFPEKCVWSTKDKNILYCAVPRESLNGNSMTLWYMGYSQFTDDVWKYDLKNNTSSLIGNLYSESNEQIDVIKPLLSTNEQYLVFINKIDGSLWSLDLSK
ncbi:MAG: hypothetical protein WCK48_02110 [bacterium]